MLARQSYAHPLLVSICDGNTRRASRRTPYVLTRAYTLRLTVLSQLAGGSRRASRRTPYVLTRTFMLRLTVLSQLAVVPLKIDSYIGHFEHPSTIFPFSASILNASLMDYSIRIPNLCVHCQYLLLTFAIICAHFFKTCSTHHAKAGSS
jgi:hypothetical protein